jgi:hypothetical protein
MQKQATIGRRLDADDLPMKATSLGSATSSRAPPTTPTLPKAHEIAIEVLASRAVHP